jgi:hypothetical protein
MPPIQLTFLEYVLTKCLGRPISRQGEGVSYWNCPRCDDRHFHTMPDKPPHPHKFKCWNKVHGVGGWWGDELDMLKEFHPDEPYGDRRERLEILRQEWQRNQAASVMGRGVQAP